MRAKAVYLQLLLATSVKLRHVYDIQRACRSGPKKKHNRWKKMKALEKMDDSAADCGVVEQNDVRRPDHVAVTERATVDNKPVCTTLKIVTAASVMLLQMFKKLFSNKKLNPVSTKLRTYAEALIMCAELGFVEVRHND